MRRLALAPVAGILLLALAPGSVQGLTPGDLDQSSDLRGSSLGSGSDQAQTFTAGKTGFLDDVELYFNGDGAITVTIQATTGGLPNGTVLATSTVTLVSADGWIDFVFASPASLTSGTMYAICFNTGVAAAVWGTDVEDPDNYVPGAAAFGSGGIWAPNTFIGDFAFRTYVRAATPTPPPNATPPVTSTGTPAPSGETTPSALVGAGLVALCGALLTVLVMRRRSSFRI